MIEVESLYRVYYLPQLNRQSLLYSRDLVQLQDLLLVLRVNPFFMSADLVKVVTKRLASSLEYFGYVFITGHFDVLAAFLNKVHMPSDFLDVLRHAPSQMSCLHNVFFNLREVKVNAFQLCAPVNGVKPRFNHLIFLRLLIGSLCLTILVRVKKVHFCLFDVAYFFVSFAL